MLHGIKFCSALFLILVYFNLFELINKGLYSHQILLSIYLKYLCVLNSYFEVIAKAVIMYM